jgi:nicotinamidase-related amidase
VLILFLIILNISAQSGKKALLLIDIQDFYFPGGKSAPVEPEKVAASDYGFKCILIHDACATKDLKFGEKTIKAEDVHYSTLSTLENYALVESTKEYLSK